MSARILHLVPAGAPIRGSAYVRDYCAGCGESIRAVAGTIGRNLCETCDPDRAHVPGTAHRPEGQAKGLGRTSG